MKRVWSVVLTVLICICSLMRTYAVDTLSVRSKDVEISNNRLFDVDVYVNCNTKLSSATIKLNYDCQVMEYRSADTEINNGQVKAVDKNGETTAIFLKSNGIEASEEIKLVSVKFKSICEDSSNIKISMTNCVDNNGNDLRCIADTIMKVNVTSNSAVGGKTDKDYSKSKDKSKDNTVEKSGKSDDKKDSKSKDKSVLSVIPEVDDEKGAYLLIVILFMIIIVGGLYYHNKTIRKIQKVLEEKEK